MTGLQDLTKSQKQIADDNGINRKTLGSRLKNGWKIEKAITSKTNSKYSRRNRKRTLYGVELSEEDIEIAKKNGIANKTLQGRFKQGWDKERAIHTPTRKQSRGYVPPSNPEIEGEELLKIIGRIKYLQMQEKDFPMPIPKPLLIKLKRTGRTLDDVQALEC